jgi:putative flippase GtrA
MNSLRDRLRDLFDRGRLLRYAMTGLASFLTHLLVLLGLVELLHIRPVTASAAGFMASVLVSFLLQRGWVFASKASLAGAIPSFALVTGFGFLLNISIIMIGVDWWSLNYLHVQAVAFVLIPVSNYLLNGLWTFAGRQ